MYAGNAGCPECIGGGVVEDETMKNHKLLAGLDELLAVMEDDVEKGRYQSYQLLDEMAAEKSDAQKLYSYDDCRIMSRIAYDYVDKVEDNLAKAREAFNTLFDTLKEQE